MFCRHCGNELPTKARFCVVCGTEVLRSDNNVESKSPSESAEFSSAYSPDCSYNGQVSASATKSSHAYRKLWIFVIAIAIAICAAVAAVFAVPKISEMVLEKKEEQRQQQIAAQKVQYPVVDGIEQHCGQYVDDYNVLSRSSDYSTMNFDWDPGDDSTQNYVMFSCLTEQVGLGTDAASSMQFMFTMMNLGMQSMQDGVSDIEDTSYTPVSNTANARCVLTSLLENVFQCQIVDADNPQFNGNADTLDDSQTDGTSSNSGSGGYQGSQEWYAPADSQFNPQTDVAEMFWECSPQASMGNGFQYHLNDDQSELMVRVYLDYPGQVVPINCLAVQVGMDLDTLKTGEGATSSHSRQIWNKGDLQIVSRMMLSDGKESWIDLWIKQQD